MRLAAVAVGLVLVSGSSGIARAAHSWDSEAGAYLSIDFGGSRPAHFGVGIELREMYAQQHFDCGSYGAEPQLFGGVAAHLTLVGFQQVRVLVAPQFGVSGPLTVNASAGGELGFGYRLGREPGPFLQPGLEVSLANTLFFRVDHAFWREGEPPGVAHSGSFDLGLRATPKSSHAPDGPSCD